MKTNAIAVNQRTTEYEQLGTLTDVQACSYWNVLQFRARAGTVLIDPESVTTRHTAIMDDLLTRRGIQHRAGAIIKKIVRV